MTTARFEHTVWAVAICAALTVASVAAQEADEAEDAPATAAEAVAVEPPGVAALDFESDELDPRWFIRDAEATLAITGEREHVASGQGALEFAYTARPGVYQQFGFSGLAVSQADALVLKLKVAAPTSLSLEIQERDGATYQGLLCLDAGRWVTVRTRLDDLILAENATDANGHLDPDQITGFALADLANLPGEVGQALGTKDGEQRLWLDDFALRDDPGAPARGGARKLGDQWLWVAEGFEEGVLWLLPIREAGLKFVGGAPGGGGDRALELTYRLDKGRWVGCVLAPPGHLGLAQAVDFHMWAKTDLNARLVVVLEERGGGKYETALKVEPNGKWQAVRLPLTEFLPGDDATDGNGQLDADRIHRVIVLVDTFDADVRPGGAGSVVVDEIGFVAPEPPDGAP